MKREAILRAAEWIERNPDKLIAGDFARDDLGYKSDPTGFRATCFCAVGRMVKESGYRPPRTTPHTGLAFSRALGVSLDVLDKITEINDEAVRTLPKPHAARFMGLYLRGLLAA